MAELTVVGKPVQRVDAEEKITGQAVYGYDLVLPNMLYGKTLFSPKAHAKIKRINTDKAKQLPGVVAVVTGEDVPWTHGESVKDKPFLAQGKVRFIGEPVAAVAAEDEDIAQAAVKLIEVDYEDLPVYTDPEEACKPGCIEIHEDFRQVPKSRIRRPGTHAQRRRALQAAHRQRRARLPGIRSRTRRKIFRADDPARGHGAPLSPRAVR